MKRYLTVVGGALLASVVACSGPVATEAADEPQQESAQMTAMDEDRFWSLVDASAAGRPSQDEQERKLSSALRALTAEEIAAFEELFAGQLRKSYSWDMWGAAFIINGGASDDGFEYFRRWLISRGRKIFEGAVSDPDSLARLIPANESEAADFESFAYVAADVWKSKTGVDPIADPDAGYFSKEGMEVAVLGEPPGEPFEEDPEYLAKRWPKLWERFGDNPLE